MAMNPLGTGTFTNGSNVVTVTILDSGQLTFFVRGTVAFVGSNPTIKPVAVARPLTVTSFELDKPWDLATGDYPFFGAMTSEAVGEAAQTLRTYVDGLAVAPTADSTAVRTNTGAVRAADGVNADEVVVVGQATEAATASKLVKRTATGAVKVANAVNADEAVALGQLPDDVADLYARNNVLGTVSQSGGVPTGALMEYGSNANGEFWKYADGKMVCTFVSAANSFSSGENTNFNILYPSAFINDVDVKAYAFAASGASGGLFCSTASLASSVNVGVYNVTSGSVSKVIHGAAIGRWY